MLRNLRNEPSNLERELQNNPINDISVEIKKQKALSIIKLDFISKIIII